MACWVPQRKLDCTNRVVQLVNASHALSCMLASERKPVSFAPGVRAQHLKAMPRADVARL
eukprot:CAMPEP_0172756078 /NCGR_PEP_ID=MMETSP1074-20121228/161122_1 /TAXON_ID=2916 /ORGANISM="Ceratium fusus, Strain PA161109" /LENGTH=59 /DNA_ID=CAMNT_0013589285 /DNA_START=9 /DNA_END=185 /DNA_ORIENTATION=+